MTNSDIRIKRDTYDELIKHLEVHAPTDEWARTLLERLQTEAKPSYLLDSGAYL
ncbi:hypothetical protein VB715_19380 [Crocosphaera sp. UHCC 0190]|uniref:hypothetical protein n=1 Tax=unclassified Crocosphaera TaxID=2623705 RepID=UPI002B1F65A7|nr:MULTISPECIES: hypothetical protein [unclassified Crocosphaera]MEA5511940.1 hypothetical protein [Crocosphaera sp. UHCC 0190]MEA5536651.1 hypothetical protein [Crocosphaera sp. XPORK-15E]